MRDSRDEGGGEVPTKHLMVNRVHIEEGLLLLAVVLEREVALHGVEHSLNKSKALGDEDVVVCG